MYTQINRHTLHKRDNSQADSQEYSTLPAGGRHARLKTNKLLE